MRGAALWRVGALGLVSLLVSLLGSLVLQGCADQGPLFVACEGADTCAPPADGCYELRVTRSDGTEGVGRQCTLECASDADCPGESECVILEGDPGETPLCLRRCLVAEDCFAGSLCTATEVDSPAEGEPLSLCLP